MNYKFKTKPYAHQLTALENSWHKEEYAYFMEMGTGKTKVLIDNLAMLYDKGKVDGALIIAPKGVVGTWYNQELPTHLPDHIENVTVLWQPNINKKQQEKLDRLFETGQDLHILVMNVEALSTDKGKLFAAKYVKDAEPGMIINTVTNEIYDGESGIDVVPVHYKRQYIEWQDRGESQGAPVKIYEAGDDLPSTTRDKFNKDRLANGNYLENTASHFVVVLGNNPATALISMKATQLKVSRKWNSMMMGIKMQGKNGLFTPPTYSHIYQLSTVQMSNDKGTWFGWDVSKVGPVTDKAIYDMAKSFAESVGKGEVQAKHGSEETTKGSSNY